MSIVIVEKTPEQKERYALIEAEQSKLYDEHEAFIRSCKHPIMDACARLLMEIESATGRDEEPYHVHHLFAVSVNHATYHAVRKDRDAQIARLEHELPETH